MRTSAVLSWWAYLPPALGLVVLFGYAHTAKEIPNILQAVAVFYFQAAAAFAAGTMVGLLFGVPSSSALTTVSAVAGSSARTVQTGRLGEIADWLTKLLIGVSITQLYPFLRTLNHYTKEVGNNLSVIGHESSGPILLASILCYGTWGFITAFLATHMYWSSKLPESGPGEK